MEASFIDAPRPGTVAGSALHSVRREAWETYLQSRRPAAAVRAGPSCWKTRQPENPVPATEFSVERGLGEDCGTAVTPAGKNGRPAPPRPSSDSPEIVQHAGGDENLSSRR